MSKKRKLGSNPIRKPGSEEKKRQQKRLKLQKKRPRREKTIQRYIDSYTEWVDVTLDSKLYAYIDARYVRQTTDVKVPREVSGTFEFQTIDVKGNRKIINYDNRNISSEDHKYHVDIMPSKYNFHTHPLQANFEYNAFVSWPSGFDFRYVLTNYDILYTHFVFSSDGVYTMHITPQFRKFLHIFFNNSSIRDVISENIFNRFTQIEVERTRADQRLFDVINMSDLKTIKKNTRITLKDPSKFPNFDSNRINTFLEYANSTKLRDILNPTLMRVKTKAVYNDYILELYDIFKNCQLFEVKLFIPSDNVTVTTNEVKFPKNAVLEKQISE